MTRNTKSATVSSTLFFCLLLLAVSTAFTEEADDKLNSPIFITAPHKESNIWINDRLIGKGRVEVSASVLLKTLGANAKLSNHATGLGISRCTFGITMDCFVLEDGSHPFIWSESVGECLSVDTKYGKAYWPLLLDSQAIPGNPYSANILFRERKESVEASKIHLDLNKAYEGIVSIRVPAECMPDYTFFSTVLQIHPSGDERIVSVFASSTREPGQALELDIEVPKDLSEKSVISGHYSFKRPKPSPDVQSSFGIRPRSL